MNTAGKPRLFSLIVGKSAGNFQGIKNLPPHIRFIGGEIADGSLAMVDDCS
jgi:hypothetical protein